ncbi:uncharacterized protein B0I36DRAFT_333168 [Microdochium trichocladiopsis]|uniref:Uncharacterized protein n=1 Tax=Microdochium trichocladiopsis TaxID=1682393 RepID=A0A9P8XYA9_9PEZI|nr:uncharacterized protein B0I36DRAFT_333168 [Microdochium trichocladiopsis]KAH7020783.1 hypothetical protein B0I36DRAFT_333168 [Microdochium trichocladiopsis]
MKAWLGSSQPECEPFELYQYAFICWELGYHSPFQKMVFCLIFHVTPLEDTSEARTKGGCKLYQVPGLQDFVHKRRLTTTYAYYEVILKYPAVKAVIEDAWIEQNWCVAGQSSKERGRCRSYIIGEVLSTIKLCGLWPLTSDKGPLGSYVHTLNEIIQGLPMEGHGIPGHEKCLGSLRAKEAIEETKELKSELDRAINQFDAAHFPKQWKRTHPTLHKPS